MRAAHLRLPAGLLVGGVAVMLAAGCGASGGGNSSAAATQASNPASNQASNRASNPAASATTSGGATTRGTMVTATETEFKIKLSRTTFAPGTYTFLAADKGSATHALEIDGPGVHDRSSPSLSPGQSASVTVTLQKGTYELYCPVGNHKALGMDTDVTVS